MQGLLVAYFFFATWMQNGHSSSFFSPGVVFSPYIILYTIFYTMLHSELHLSGCGMQIQYS